MNAQEAARVTLTTIFRDAWAGLGANAFSIAYENQTHTLNGKPYVRFQVHEINAAPASIGSRTRFKRHYGMVSIVVYALENTGTKQLNDLADDILKAFEEKNFVTVTNYAITCKTGTIKRPGLQNGYYPAVVTVPYWFDECIRA